ncbi:ribonuclease R [candidate division GN15 bacterium]|nr:ribonuclease R [candidate division GN15 bacterium]
MKPNMAFDKDQIVEFVRQKSNRPMKVKELAAALDIPKPDYRRFRNVIRELIESGELVRLKRNRIGLASELNVVVAPISITRSGVGFVEHGQDEPDILIPERQLHTALDGDKVMVRRTGTYDGRPTGAVIRVVERAARNIVGAVHTSRHFVFVVPDNPRIHRDILIPAKDTQDARDGEKVVAVLEEWDDPNRNPVGRITEVLGFPGDPGVDMQTVVKSFNLPEEFPSEVIDEAERASAASIEEEAPRRDDLTDEIVYTIDPSDAKDHDDAVSVERLGDGYRLGVHIADVSHFVQPGSALDKEALTRGNSVYLPGMVIPMIPEALSNDICSLRPDRVRLAHSVIIDFDSSGEMQGWKIKDTLIKSRAKLSYEQVQQLFDTGKPDQDTKPVTDNLLVARELARILCKRRFAEGSLDFDLPEAKIVLDQQGRVLEIGNRIRLESHRLVEEFMLAANKAVAVHVFKKNVPFIYRVHERPDVEKIQDFADMMKRLGYSFPVSEHVKPAVFARFLEKVEGTPEEGFVNELMLRSMKKAVYQRDDIGHFGLAFRHYTHFTSPIRRYPDLLVHRLLRKLKRGRYPKQFGQKVSELIDRTANHCSETERLAETAERHAVKVKQISYMAEHVGEVFPGVITGVTGYGFFVRLDELGVEGLVRVSTIDDDYYQFDEKNYQLIGRRSKKAYRLGSTIEVGVARVDKAHNELDLYLAKAVEEPDLPPHKAERKGAAVRRRKAKAKTTSKKGTQSSGKSKPKTKTKTKTKPGTKSKPSKKTNKTGGPKTTRKKKTSRKR